MKPESIVELQEIIPAYDCIQLRGGGSKNGLAPRIGEPGVVEMGGLAGILDYKPQEFTFTALAGTPLEEIEQALAENRQYLPFDPPLVECGATLGGTVAAGLSGAGRYRYGGLRDFLLGAAFVDAKGRLVRGGGKVVKNAAGFDLPKLLIGSLGRYGAIVELSFKVFPSLLTYATLRAKYSTFEEVLEAISNLVLASVEIYALELLPEKSGYSLLVRLGGAENGMGVRLRRVGELLGRGEALEGDENDFWRLEREFAWVPAGSALVKVPITPRQAPELEATLSQRAEPRRYSVGVNVTWVAWTGALDELDRVLQRLGLSGLVILGKSQTPRLGVRRGETLTQRVKQALDPNNRWGGI